MQCRALSHVDENLRGVSCDRIKEPSHWPQYRSAYQGVSALTSSVLTNYANSHKALLARGAKHQINIPCTISPPKPPIYPRHPNYTTPTPSFPILGDFPTFAPNFERDFCIRTPIFRWTPLPEAIPSRRISPLFSHFPPTLTNLPHPQHLVLYRSYTSPQSTYILMSWKYHHYAKTNNLTTINTQSV